MEGLCQPFFLALETMGEKAFVVPTLRGSLLGGPYPPGLVSKTQDGALCPPWGLVKASPRSLLLMTHQPLPLDTSFQVLLQPHASESYHSVIPASSAHLFSPRLLPPSLFFLLAPIHHSTTGSFPASRETFLDPCYCNVIFPSWERKSHAQ